VETTAAARAETHSTSKRIQLPAKYFTFMEDVKGGKGFKVKCLLCHQSKTKYSPNGQPDYLSITNNSAHNAKRHMKVNNINIKCNRTFRLLNYFIFVVQIPDKTSWECS
jgi:cytochrome c2